MCVTDHHGMTLAVKVALNPNTANQHMCVTDHFDMTLAFKVALNPNTTNQLTSTPHTIICKLPSAGPHNHRQYNRINFLAMTIYNPLIGRAGIETYTFGHKLVD